MHGAYFLLKQLMEADRNDLIYTFTSKTDYPSWGNMLAANWGHFFIFDRPETRGIVTSPWTTFLPAAAIGLTVLTLTLLGEGVRRAFDPGSAR